MTLTARLGSPFTEHEITLKCLLSSRILRFVSSDHGMYEPGYCSNIIEQLDSIPQRVNNHMIVFYPPLIDHVIACMHMRSPINSAPIPYGIDRVESLRFLVFRIFQACVQHSSPVCLPRVLGTRKHSVRMPKLILVLRVYLSEWVKFAVRFMRIFGCVRFVYFH